jgi:Flp pilus assembly protein TadD
VPASNAQAHHKLGRYFYETGRYEEAAHELRKAILIAPDDVEARVMLSICYDREADFTRAEEAYHIAIELRPDAAYVYNNLGASYCRQGKWEAARETLKKAVELSGEDINKEMHYNLGAACAMTGRDEEALQTFAKVGPMAEVNYRMAHIYALRDMGEEAGRRYAAAVELDPSSAIFRKGYEEWKRARGTMMTVDATQAPVGQKEAKRETFVDPGMEISNGNGVGHMAADLRQYLKGKGFVTKRMTNASRFDCAKTTLFFRERYLQVSMELAKQMPRMPMMKELKQWERPDLNVKIVLGRDMAQDKKLLKGG